MLDFLNIEEMNELIRVPRVSAEVMGDQMDGLRISLFGSVRIVGDDGTAVSLAPATQALVAYLLLNRQRCHPREIVAGQFWGEYDESRARDCLNTTLWRLRQALEPKDKSRGAYLLATPTGEGEIGFNVDSCYWLDVEEFEQTARPLITQADGLSAEGAQELEQALALYVGDVLEGMHHDWVLRERERLRQLYLASLICLMGYYRRLGAHERCLAFGNRILALEPLREDIHRAMIETYWASGQRALAVQQYAACCEILADELGIGPMEETVALYQEILASGAEQTAVTRPLSPSSSQPATNMDEAIRQLSLAMQVLEQAQAQVQHAIKIVKQQAF